MGTWLKVNAATSRISDLAALEELAGRFPDSGTVQVRYFNALIGAGDAPAAYALLDRIQARGYRFSANSEAQINAFISTNGYFKPLSLTQRAGDNREASEVTASVPPSVHIVESVLRERRSGRLYVTSIASRGLFRQDGKDGWERVALGETGGLGGFLQAPDGRIWLSSAAYDPTPDPGTAIRGLIAFDPATGAVQRVVAPPRATPSDLALGADGSLFAADPRTGAIYRAAKDDRQLQVFVAPGTFRSAQGMAVGVDGRLLYVSDYGYGLAVIDLRTRRVDRLPAPGAPFVDGADGLLLYGDELIAIQNGAQPTRIVAHRLAADGRSITDTRVL